MEDADKQGDVIVIDDPRIKAVTKVGGVDIPKSALRRLTESASACPSHLGLAGGNQGKRGRTFFPVGAPRGIAGSNGFQ